MAYEKYIKKDGKIYGPYLYQSKRVDGKVISEYQGQKKIDYKKFLWIIPFVFLILLGAYLIGNKTGKITGNAVLNLNANYQEGKALNGQLQFFLSQGELIPANSTVVFENGGQKYEYLLTGLVSDQTTSGNFYVPGKTVSGSGDGFGISGTKYAYPDVQFTLIISSPETSTAGSGPGSNPSTQTENTTANAKNTTEITNASATNETGVITTAENASATQGQAQTAPTESPPASNTTAQTAPTPSQTQTTSTSSENSSPGLLAVVSNFFLGLTPTGKVIAQAQSEIQGTASAGNPFTYSLKNGESAEIKPTSVNSNGSQLPDDTVTLSNNGNIVSVSTNYSKQEQGFGIGYSGTSTKTLSINLNQLNLQLQKGELDVHVLYNGEEIASIATNLSSGTVAGTSTPENISPIVNQTENVNITNINATQNTTANNTIQIINQSLQLTPEERAALINQFGNISVQAKEAVSTNGFITVRYELGNYWIENSYPDNLDNATLSSFMQADRTKWLKEIADNLLQINPQSTELPGLLGNYSY